MLIQVGTEEVLENDAELVHQSAAKAKVDATLTRYYGMFHVFQILGEITPESREAWSEVTSFIAMKFLHEKQEVLQKLPVSTFVIRPGNESRQDRKRTISWISVIENGMKRVNIYGWIYLSIIL